MNLNLAYEREHVENEPSDGAYTIRRHSVGNCKRTIGKEWNGRRLGMCLVQVHPFWSVRVYYTPICEYMATQPPAPQLSFIPTASSSASTCREGLRQ
jgi:hypothetical protein